MNLAEGQNKIIELVSQGKLTQDVLNDIVDYAIDTIKQTTKKYRMVVSDSNSSSFKVPECGIRKIGSLPLERKIYPSSNRDRTSDHFMNLQEVDDDDDKRQHRDQSQKKMLSEKPAAKKPVLSTSRRAAAAASSDNNRLYHRSSSESEIAQRYSFIDPHHHHQ